MEAALIPLRGDRPAVISMAGGHVYVSVHDAAFMTEKQRWKQRLAAVHPDRTGKSAFKFNTLHTRYEAWLNQQRWWYGSHNLPLPGTSEVPDLSTLRKPRVKVDYYIDGYVKSVKTEAPQKVAVKSKSRSSIIVVKAPQKRNSRGPYVTRTEVQVRAALDAAKTQNEACQLLGIGSDTLQRLVREYGLLTCHQRRQEQRLEEIKVVLRSSATLSEAAVKLDMLYESLSRRLKADGVKWRELINKNFSEGV